MNRCETCRLATPVIEHGRVLFYHCNLQPVWQFQTRCNQPGRWGQKS